YQLPTPQQTSTANITALTLGVSGITAGNKTYDGTTTATHNTTGAALTGVVSGDSSKVSLVTSSAVGTFASASVGTGITVTVSGLSLSGTAAGNYQLPTPQQTSTANITALTLGVSGITAGNKVYDGGTTATLNTTGAALSGVLSGDTGKVSLVTSGAVGTFASASVGTGITVTVSGLSLSGTAAGNYQLPTPQQTSTANITALTLGVSGITAGNKVYDGGATATLNTGSAALTGVLSGDSSKVSLVTSGAVGTFGSASVGTGITVTVSGLSLSGTAAGNYQLPTPQQTSTANITALTLGVSGITAGNKVYDGGTAATLNTTGAALTGVVSGDSSKVSLVASSAVGTFGSASVGTGITVTVSGLSLSGTAAGNYQ